MQAFALSSRRKHLAVPRMRGLLSRVATIGVLAVSTVSLNSPALASVTYDVNLTGGGVTFSGTITTDGASGFLLASDITSFHLITSGLVSLALDSTTTGFICPLTGCELQSVGSQLIAGPQGLTAQSEIDFGRTTSGPLTNKNTIRFVSDPTTPSTQAIAFGSTGIPYMIDNVNGTTPIIVGNTISAVPLPSSFWLLGSGVLGLISTARRKRSDP